MSKVVAQTFDMEMRQCRTCGETKPYSTGFYKNYRVCKTCRVAQIRATQIERMKDPHYAESVKARMRLAQLKYNYGVTAEQYQTLVQMVDGLCEACQQPPKDNEILCVDHCHETGAIRGMLCRRCNAAVGFAQDDAKILRALADYLEGNAVRSVT